MMTDTTTDPWPIRFRACCPPYPGGRIVEVLPEHGWPGGIVWAPDPALLPAEHPCAPREVRLARGWLQILCHAQAHGSGVVEYHIPRHAYTPEGYEPVPGAPGMPRFEHGMWSWWVQRVGGAE